jgi:signal transduction histidine kinase
MQNQTSNRLKNKTSEIMTIWEARVSQEVLASRHLKTLALRDSIPEYLLHMADALSTTINRSAARNKLDKIEGTRVGRKHGKERAGSLNYTMDQMILEYHILRQVICDVLEEEQILTPVEREVIVGSIEQAVNDAASEFSETLRDIQEQLSHTLVHDLRTPITVAKASAQMILRRPDDVDNCINKASRIVGNMDRIDNMIRDLLDASRIRAGQGLPLEFNECDLDWIVREVAEELNSAHPDRIKLVSSGQCQGYWNQNGLRRMLENLVNNALKYGHEHAPVTIYLSQTAQTATIKVHNQGAAIASDERDILFQQYRRSRTIESEVGWGLGLTVVKGMVDAHQGSIEVQSEEGHGTSFTIDLPKDSR